MKLKFSPDGSSAVTTLRLSGMFEGVPACPFGNRSPVVGVMRLREARAPLWGNLAAFVSISSRSVVANGERGGGEGEVSDQVEQHSQIFFEIPAGDFSRSTSHQIYKLSIGQKSGQSEKKIQERLLVYLYTEQVRVGGLPLSRGGSS